MNLRKLEDEVYDFVTDKMVQENNFDESEHEYRSRRMLNLILDVYTKHDEELTPDEAYDFLFVVQKIK